MPIVWIKRAYIKIFIIKKRIYRTVLESVIRRVKWSWTFTWDTFTCTFTCSPHNTFKDCSVYALLNNENVDVSFFDSHYRHLIGCVWCMTWWCWWCCHWSNGDFFTNHLVGIGLCLHSPIPGILKWTLFNLTVHIKCDVSIHCMMVLPLVFFGNECYMVKICTHYCFVSIKSNTFVIDVNSFISWYMHVRRSFPRRDNIFIGCNICYV
jgi:hypothetical protein